MFRPIRIYKYLDKDSVEVDFVTHGRALRFREAVHDDTLLAEVHPAPRVYRVPALIPHDVLPALVARLRGKRRAGDNAARPEAAPAAKAASGTAPRGRRSLYRRLAMLVYFPDHFFLWGWLAAATSVVLLLRRRYDVVYTTSHPESGHLAGLVLERLGVRWVADYRYGGPLWVKELVGYPKPPIRQRIERWYQRRVLSRADMVITQSEPIRADFCREFSLDPDKLRVIPSGYDEHDFRLAKTGDAPFATREHEVHLLHVGTMEGVDATERRHLVEALNRLDEALRAGGRQLVVHAVGSDVFGPERAETVRFEYHHHGVVVHWRLPAYLAAADCYLLTTIAMVRGFIPSKVWEYLRAGGPILVAGPRDEVWTMTDEAGVGVHLTSTGGHGQPAGTVAEALVARLHDERPLHPSVARYSWESRARAVQEVFAHLARPQTATARTGEARV